MKTTKFFSVLSLVLIFAAVNSAFADDNPRDKSKKPDIPNIRYEVAIHLSLGVTLCNTYYIQITDESGRLAAPRKAFVPGTSKYVINEMFSVPGRARIVSLVLPSNVDPYACPILLVTKPEVKLGPFLPGRTISVDLFPLIQKGAMKE
jgi:hypothetical protein